MKCILTAYKCAIEQFFCLVSQYYYSIAPSDNFLFWMEQWIYGQTSS